MEAKRELAQQFLKFAIDHGVLKFGDFTLKSGRKSPYFFNTGLFNTGETLRRLIEFYIERLEYVDNLLSCDVIYGAAYKGIPLATALAVVASEPGFWYEPMPYAFNRKEAKTHGDGGTVVGHPLDDSDVLIIDDVISSGLSIRESVEIIKANGGTPVGVVISLDRQERGQDTNLSAVQQVEDEHGIPVYSIATLSDLIDHATRLPTTTLNAIKAYKEQYGV